MELGLWVSILPSVFAILLAMITRQVIPSLLAGLWLGAFIKSPGLLSSLSGTISYILAMLSDAGNLDVLLFLYVFSGLVTMIQLAGGVSGFTHLMERVVQSGRGALLSVAALAPITFIDCGFRVVAAGAVTKPLAKEFKVSPERLAFTLNNTASPLISLIPIATTYVGYMLGVLAVGLRSAGVAGSPFIIFLQTIPFNFFSFTAILTALLSIFSPWQFREMAEADKKAAREDGERHKPLPEGIKNNVRGVRGVPAFGHEAAEDLTPGEARRLDTARDQMGTAAGKDINVTSSEHNENEMKKSNGEGPKAPMNMEHDHDMEIKSKLPPRALNLLIPIGILIPLSFLMVWLDGRAKGDTLLEIFSQANASRAMFQALFLTTVITALLYLLQRLSLKDLTNGFIKGGNKLMVTIVILVVAWPIATVSRDLGLPKLIETTLGATLPAVWVPAAAFVITAAVTYFIGSSWGSWALMMPLAIPLAAASGASIPLAAAAVFSGGTFGDVTSPLSGMTAMSSGVAEAEHMSYVRAMTPYNLTAGAAAALLFVVVPMLI
ncbi:MAG: hypothetical protein FH756_00790 [Firmicutes bacterium]|nr:hypothetical protein [Bacillota bacterium]